MAMIESLVLYYETLSSNPKNNMPVSGYSVAKVSYAAVISREGELLHLLPLKVPSNNGGKEVPISMLVPQQVKRSSGILANFLCENSSYFFGFDKKGNPKRSEECFAAFQKKAREILYNVFCDEAIAVLQFLEHWDVATATEHPEIQKYLDELNAGANLVFKLDKSDEYVHMHPVIREAWEKQLAVHSDDSESMQTCLVTGKRTKIARLHPSISGIRGGQSMGNTLVSFNAPSFESYGKEKAQGLNAPISEYVTFAYTTALNCLLSGAKNKLALGDATVVFWANAKNNEKYEDLISKMIMPDMIQEENQSDIQDDQGTAKVIGEIFSNIREGKKIDLDALQLDENVRFYILALSPNAARISVRFYLENKFGHLVQKIAQHYKDMAIEKQYEDRQLTSFSIWRILFETVSPTAKVKVSSPFLTGAVMQAILNGTKYPSALFQAVMQRIRVEKDVNYFKASIIKAYLIRLDEAQYKEVLTMSYNKETDNKAYILGNLFAVLEKAQLDANPGINTTIKDRYFASACANPYSVFPTLLKLSQHHIKKAEYGYVSDNRIGKILCKLEVVDNPFPKKMSLEDQGIFVLGYYHQKNDFYKTKEEK